jgi:hypothetical protein
MLNLATYSLLALIVGSATPANDGQEGRDWPFKEVEYWCCGPQVYYVEVASSGQIRFANKEVSLHQLRQHLSTVHELNPPFYVVLNVVSKASPVASRRVRQVFDQAALCSEGFCVERKRWNAFWRKRGEVAPR